MDMMTLQIYLADFQNWSSQIIGVYGYLGIFVVSFISAASIILPIPGFAVIFAAGAFLDPFIVSIVSGIGFGAGELTGVLLGKGSRKALEKRYEEKVKNLEEKTNRYGAFFVFFLFAVTPLPDDISGIFAGVINYDWKKFLVASILGKTILSLFMAYTGHFGINWLLNFVK
ncbi:MAG: YqaA family protein [Candidatus Aenigmatarchaeota archaeon]